MIEAYVKKILASRVYDLAIETPTTFAPKLSKRLGIRVSLKREDMQEIFSFKVRGAYNKLVSFIPGKEAGCNSGLCGESCSRSCDCGKRVGNRSNNCDEPQYTGHKGRCGQRYWG